MRGAILPLPQYVFVNVYIKVTKGARILSPHHRIQTGSGAAQPPIKWVPGSFSPGVKRPVREADHSSQRSFEVKNAWSYTPLPHTSSWGGS